MRNANCSLRAMGFTIVEMVVVIVLVGITAAVIVPRFLEPNAFDEAAVQDGLISTIRAAQQAALGRGSVSFEIDASGGNWVFAAKASGDTIRSVEISNSSVVLETGSAVATGADTCATGFDDDIVAGASAFELLFDSQGNLEQFTFDGAGPPTEPVDANFNGVRICVNNTETLSVCVSPAGYAYAGNCDA